MYLLITNKAKLHLHSLALLCISYILAMLIITDLENPFCAWRWLYWTWHLWSTYTYICERHLQFIRDIHIYYVIFVFIRVWVSWFMKRTILTILIQLMGLLRTFTSTHLHTLRLIILWSFMCDLNWWKALKCNPCCSMQSSSVQYCIGWGWLPPYNFGVVYWNWIFTIEM